MTPMLTYRVGNLAPLLHEKQSAKFLLLITGTKKTREQIVKEFGVSRDLVSKALKSFSGSRPIPLYKIRHIYRLKHENGMTPTPIASRVRCSVDTVKKYLNLENPYSEFRIYK
jgi:hypothetical protein